MPLQSLTQSVLNRPALTTFLFACILYATTLRGTFVYDDRDIVRDDPRVTQPGRWVEYFKEPYFPSAADTLWRPLPCLSYVLHNRIHGATAWPHHLANILLHAAVSALVAAYARRLVVNYSADGPMAADAVALMAGLLFAAHPVHVEVAANIVGRAESMCTMGIVGGLLLFERRPLRGGHVLGIIGCFIFAALSKEHGVLLAPMLAIVYAVRRLIAREPAAAPGEKRSLQLLFIGLCFSLLGYIAARESIMRLDYEKFFMHWTVNPVVRAQGINRVLAPISILGRYAGLLVFPIKLSPDYGAWITNYVQHRSDPYLYIGFAAILIWVIATIMALRRRAVIALICLLCFAVAYFLISNFIFIIGTAMGERLIYLASVFFIILIAWLLSRLPRKLAGGIFWTIMVLFAIRTITYATMWNDEHWLMRTARIAHPQSVYLHILEAHSWLQLGNPARADEVLANARKLCPESPDVWSWSALAAKRLGLDAQQQEYQRRAFELLQNPPHMPPGSGRKQMFGPLPRPSTSPAPP